MWRYGGFLKWWYPQIMVFSTRNHPFWIPPFMETSICWLLNICECPIKQVASHLVRRFSDSMGISPWFLQHNQVVHERRIYLRRHMIEVEAQKCGPMDLGPPWWSCKGSTVYGNWITMIWWEPVINWWCCSIISLIYNWLLMMIFDNWSIIYNWSPMDDNQ